MSHTDFLSVAKLVLDASWAHDLVLMSVRGHVSAGYFNDFFNLLSLG